MRTISTGDVVRAFKIIWPKITGEMVRAAADEGTLKVSKPNPFSRKGRYDYDLQSIYDFLSQQKDIPSELRQQAMALLQAEIKAIEPPKPLRRVSR